MKIKQICNKSSDYKKDIYKQTNRLKINRLKKNKNFLVKSSQMKTENRLVKTSKANRGELIIKIIIIHSAEKFHIFFKMRIGNTFIL